MTAIVAESVNEFCRKNGIEHLCLEGPAAWRVAKRWRQRYATTLHAQTGQWVLHSRDWHVFSYRYYPAVSGARAETEYSAIKDHRYWAFSSALSDYVLDGKGRPPDVALVQDLVHHCRMPDIILAAYHFEWTMAIIGDEAPSLGPFFAESGLCQSIGC